MENSIGREIFGEFVRDSRTDGRQKASNTVHGHWARPALLARLMFSMGVD